MIHYKISARVTMYATRLVMAVMIVLLAAFPMLVQRYHAHFRPLADSERTAILLAFYISSVPVLFALWNMDKLLGNILQQLLFTLENVSHVRRVRWCCFSVSAICLIAAFGFPSMLFISMIMGFLGLVVTVVGQLLKAAVAIQEENDLTV